jgi:hypothetical protein
MDKVVVFYGNTMQPIDTCFAEGSSRNLLPKIAVSNPVQSIAAEHHD